VNSGRPRYDHELLGSSFAHNAELATPEPQGPLNIVTPCHGAELELLPTLHEYKLSCTAEGCYNTWHSDGTVDEWEAE